MRPRSGLARKFGSGIVNSPGTIDSDYRGEVGIVLINHGAEPFTVEPLARIAQLVIAPVLRAEVVLVAELDDTDRGERGGDGSTGATLPHRYVLDRLEDQTRLASPGLRCPSRR